MLFRKTGAACLLGGAFVLASLSAQAEVFINEIHYDDADTPTTGDTNESLEIVATAGEDLTLYDIVLYNGSNATAAVTYDTDAIPAGSNVTCGSNVRIAVLTYPVNGIQNGANDAIAIVRRSDSAVMQFISYEGAATASNGPANGMTSTNIPVSEISTTVEGTSLQLTGTGSANASFTWAASATSTFGTCNNNQVFNLGTPVNVLPVVSSSNPVNGGTVPSGLIALTVTFNEPVSEVTPGAGFTLSCAIGGNIDIMASTPIGSPPNEFVLIPGRLTEFQDGDTCVLTVVASQIIDADGANPAQNTVINFTVVNPIPFVVNTSPVNNGNVLPESNTFSVTFSEYVTATASAFSLQCSIDGTVFSSVVYDGSFTLTSSIGLQEGQTCTLTVFASEITDQEGAHPSQNTVVNFTVAPPPNVAPYVVSTTPAHNAVGVPGATDFRVVFSEMVGVDHESFVLSCTLSGVVPLRFNNKMLAIVNGAGRAVTLVSGTVLQAGETCTLTVIAAGVTDDDGLAMSQDKVVSFKIAGGSVASYYNRVNTSSAEQLRCSLNTVIRGHTVYPYSASTTDTWDILEIADEDPNNSSRILDIYKNRSFTKGSDRAGTGSGITYNREHTWPNSLGFGSTTGNLGLPHGPYTDTHMLYLSDTNYNADRGNSPYSYCTQGAGCSERATEINNGSGGGTGVYPGNSNWVNSNFYETWSKRQGDVARAILYMAIRYEGGTHTITGQNEPDLELTDNAGLVVATSASPAYMGLLTDLLLWHQADPPDAAEVARNEVIYNFQGNRNPFINHPEWGTQALFTSAKPASCTLNINSSNPIKRNRAIPSPKPPRRSIRN